ncbi:glycosyl hydrolase [Sphingobacterium siyangense subsp. cladoniae]|uniref:glycoside hydrolase family 26 protein n=1 Tax=Sphingobacterium siyangense TaxID=459529 RepID=UPI0031FA1EC7
MKLTESRRYLSKVVICCAFSLYGLKLLAQLPADLNATKETKALYQKINTRREKGISIGHQDDLAYGHGWYKVKGRSDVKDVTGKYPNVIGWEIGDIELGKPYNLDSVYFDDMRQHIMETHKRGGITTLSWHANNIVSGKNAWDCAQDTVVRSILPAGSNHQQYLQWLDRTAGFLLSLKDNQGNLIPVVLRPYHEHTGAWFWWGAKQCSPQEYKDLWKMTAEYFQQKHGIHHLLYCYSPSETESEAQFLERYPGDEYVDLVAFDCYVPGNGTLEDIAKYKVAMAKNISIIAEYARKSGKIPTIGETGLESIKNPSYFTEVVYPLIRGKGLAWILFWRNAYEKDKPNHYYVPYKGHPAASDFKKFANKKNILLH